MYNSDIPTRAELPSTRQLIKSTIIAIIAAIVILLTVVLPSEYALDPTGVGKILKLTEMGDIKQQLSIEAEADKKLELESSKVNDKSSSFLGGFFGLFVSSAYAQSPSEIWTDTLSYTFAPGEGAEIKLVMQKEAEVEFQWSTAGGKLNYDLHGDGSGNQISYEKGRAATSGEGILKAAFTGKHGWFWRNRDSQDVTMTLKVRGAYSEVVLPE